MITLAQGLRMYDADKTHTIEIVGMEDDDSVVYTKSTDQMELYYASKKDIMRDYYPIKPLYVVQAIYMEDTEIIAGDKVSNFNVYLAINKTKEDYGAVQVPTLNLGKAFLKQGKDKLTHDWMPLCNTENYLDQDGAVDISAILGGKVLEAVREVDRVYGYLDTNILYEMSDMLFGIESWIRKNDGLANSWAEAKYPYQKQNKILETIIASEFEEHIDSLLGLISEKRLKVDEVKNAFDNFGETIQSSTEKSEALVELLRNIIEKTIYKNSAVDINSADVIKYTDNIILDELEKKVQDEGSILVKVKIGYELQKHDIYLIKFRLIPKEPPLNQEEISKFMSIKK